MIENLWWASWVLAAFGVATMFFAGQRKWWAWCIGLLTEALWIWYAIVTKQYGFIIAALAYMMVYFKNTIQWRKHGTT